MKKKKGLLYYVYCALGEKSHPRCNKTADRVAVIRLIAFLSILITNSFIVANALRHWNDIQLDKPVKCIIVNKL
jgi:uncharacterized protein (UPF0212 family)